MVWHLRKKIKEKRLTNCQRKNRLESSSCISDSFDSHFAMFMFIVFKVFRLYIQLTLSTLNCFSHLIFSFRSIDFCFVCVLFFTLVLFFLLIFIVFYEMQWMGIHRKHCSHLKWEHQIKMKLKNEWKKQYIARQIELSMMREQWKESIDIEICKK